MIKSDLRKIAENDIGEPWNQIQKQLTQIRRKFTLL
jgi:hypothetical protein